MGLYTKDMFEMIQGWLAQNLLPIVFIWATAYLVARFGNIPLTGLIRRTVTYRAHGDKTEQDVKKRQDTLISICTAVFKVVVWLTAVYTIIGRFGIDPAPLLTGAGVVGFALAFGAQSLIKDFVSGIFIILENQYRVGDTVELNKATGVVEKISIRTTVIRDDEGNVHYVPNGSINESVNKTMGYAKIHISIGVNAKTDVDKAAAAINKVGQRLFRDEKWSKKLLEAPRFLNIGNFSEKSLELKVSGKTKPGMQWNVTSELRERLTSALEKEGVVLAPDTETEKTKK